uniref:DNA replication factor Cdt1 C-terminal domain-containing protein n=1 Tax=Bionectria ochroleuca TaxID=29856 RepID=A0A8H7KBR7_BIOOC
MLHVAHSRSTAPVDVRSIAPNISMAWGKRQVTVEDIQRCIAIQSSAKYGYTSPFIVSDYGRGKICVEIDSQHNAAGINEDRLCKQFEESLRHICTERTVDEMTDVDITFENLSLADLPKAAIKNKDLGLNANPMLAKGQRTLSSLKSDLATREQEKQTKQEALSNNPMLNPDGSKMSLLDRIRLKQLVKDNGPVPPSGPELQRRAALNRVMDVSATLSMLSLSNPVSLPRQAFSMAAVMDRLKDSLRMPISKEEATTCIRLLATEVAPEWIRIVALGGRENVVLQRNMQPVDRVLNERVQKLLG